MATNRKLLPKSVLPCRNTPTIVAAPALPSVPIADIIAIPAAEADPVRRRGGKVQKIVIAEKPPAMATDSAMIMAAAEPASPAAAHPAAETTTAVTMLATRRPDRSECRPQAYIATAPARNGVDVATATASGDVNRRLNTWGNQNAAVLS